MAAWAAMRGSKMGDEISVQREELLKSVIADLERQNAGLRLRADAADRLQQEVAALRRAVKDLSEQAQAAQCGLKKAQLDSQSNALTLTKKAELSRQYTKLRDKCELLSSEKKQLLLQTERLRDSLRKLSAPRRPQPCISLSADEIKADEIALLKARVEQLYAALCGEVERRQGLEQRLKARQICGKCEKLTRQLQEQRQMHAAIIDDLRYKNGGERGRQTLEAIAAARINPKLRDIIQASLRRAKTDLAMALEDIFLAIAVAFDNPAGGAP